VVKNLFATSSEFIIDGIKSKDIGIDGVSIIRINASEIQSPFMGAKSIIEEKIPNRDIPYFYGVSLEPIEFSLKFSTLDKEYDSKVLFELGKIFGKRTYVPFQSVDAMEKIYYVIATSPISIITYGQYRGWLEISLRCNAPWGWSLPEVSTFDLSDITAPTIIEIENKSNVNEYYYPELWIDLKGDSTGVILKNLSDGEREFQIQVENTNEQFYFNNQLKQIESSIGKYRLSNFNKKWLRLLQGVNRLEVTGKSVIQIRCQFPLFV
jgi:hypothetical protein